MRAPLRAAACWQLLGAASGHGAMYEPPNRNSLGMNFMAPGCAGGACFWYTVGTSIGCTKSGGPPTNPGIPLTCMMQGHDPCCNDTLAEPTIGDDPSLRTFNLDGNNSGYPCNCCGGYCGGTCPPGSNSTWGRCGRGDGDWTRTNPWRKPGSAHVLDPCGMAGGSLPQSGQPIPYGGGDPPAFHQQGALGSQLPPLMEKTVWVAGTTAEVAWGIFANHGGGYSYRLCPAGSELTEECFQKTPLDFVGDTQWIQFGPTGMDVNNRTEIPASQVSVGTVPAGSQWRRNPIPACKPPATFTPVNKLYPNAPTGGGTDPAPCDEPLFPPAVPGLFGFGLGGAPKKVISSEVGIVDKVHVPDVPPGDYVLGFRWDCEQTSQVWQTCGDVTIKASGPATKPFTPLSGCDQCCGAGACANCTRCVDDKTGDCAYCWEKVRHPFPEAKNLPMTLTCLGHEAEDGGPTPGLNTFTPADTFHPAKLAFLVTGVSPGCPKCWADEDMCTPRERA